VAKPGGDAARLLSAGIDLSRGRVASLDEQRLELERKAGMRCGGCKRRITNGFAFTTFVLAETKGAADRLATARTYACSRDDCDYAARVAEHAIELEMLPERVYLDERRGERIAGAANPALDTRQTTDR
jgi:hypothetical protein